MLLRIFYKWILVLVVMMTSATVWGQLPSSASKWDDLSGDAASNCGKDSGKFGFGALSRMPSVRIVVYDPVSNSFGFVRTCTSSDDNSAFNQDYLDRERLALTTQKIRLLILPYNSRTTHLTLVKTNGHGVEFKALFSKPAATDAAAADASKTKQDAGTTPPANSAGAGAPKPSAGNAAAVQDKNAAWNLKKNSFQELLRTPLANVDAFMKPNGIPPESLEAQKHAAEGQLQTVVASIQSTKDPRDVLAGVSAFFDEYREKAISITSSVDLVKSATACLLRSLPETDAALTKKLAAIDADPLESRAHPFSVTYDRTLADIMQETVSRHKAINAIVDQPPRSCMKGIEKGTSFEDQVQQLDAVLDGAHQGLGLIGILLDKASDGLTNIRNDNPADVKESDWKTTVDAYSDTLKNLRTYHAGVQKLIDDARTAADALPAAHATLVETLEGPAAWIQRINYPPLEENQSITFAFQRSVTDAKDTTPATVDNANSLELRSAPVDSVRFSTGVVKSSFRNPSFKAGPTEPKLDSSGNPVHDSTGKAITQHQILFDEENNGATLVGVFVRHYWERRCPLLRPTVFERFVPTFSLGLPITKSDPLDQVLLGLDWELIPGVELNIGGHFGKANRLIRNFDGRPLNVGDYVPSDVDTSLLQSKHYSSGVYFGISLNSEAFAMLTGNQK